MATVNPPIGSISNTKTSLDSEDGRQRLLIILNQLWQRTGGGSDDVGDGQLRELFAWSTGGSATSREYFSVSTAHTTAGNEVIEATAALTVTLNAYPDELETVTVVRNGIGNVVIDGNGNNIAGSSTYTMLADGEVRELTFLNGEWF